MPYTSPRPRLRPLNLARLETETETVLHKVFMPVTSSMVKVYIRDRIRDRDLENGLYESETETETLESRETRDETRVSSVSALPAYISITRSITRSFVTPKNDIVISQKYPPKYGGKLKYDVHKVQSINYRKDEQFHFLF